MLQIALVPDEHDDDVRVGVVPELLQPAGDVVVRRPLRDVVDEERADCAAVVPVSPYPVSNEQGRRRGERNRLNGRIKRREKGYSRSGDRAITFLTSCRPKVEQGSR